MDSLFATALLAALLSLLLAIMIRVLISFFASKKLSAIEVIYDADNILSFVNLRNITKGQARITVRPSVEVRLHLADVNGGWLSRIIKRNYKTGRSLPFSLASFLFLIIGIGIILLNFDVKTDSILLNIFFTILVVAGSTAIFSFIIDLDMSFPFMDRAIRVYEDKVNVTNSIVLPLKSDDKLTIILKKSRGNYNSIPGHSIVISNGRDEVPIFTRNFVLSYAYTDEFMESLKVATQKAVDDALAAVRRVGAAHTSQ